MGTFAEEKGWIQNRLMFITLQDSQHSIKEQVGDYLAGGGQLVQFRVKGHLPSGLAREAEMIQRKCEHAEARMIVNDYVDVAQEVGAWGVHLGQDDAPPKAARATLGTDAVVGATAHSWEEVLALKDAPIDYIGLGPLHFTSTKTNLAQILGYQGVEDILGRMLSANINIPVYVVGGVENQDVRPLIKMGAYGVAVSGSIALASDIVFATQKFLESIAKGIR